VPYKDPEKRKAWQRAYYAANPARAAAYSRKCNAAHQEERREYRRAYRAANPDKATDAQWARRQRHPDKAHAACIRRYGLTSVDYERMLTAQGGGCAVCGRPPAKNRLHVDHDHSTGKVRELLCTSCNTQPSTVENTEKLARLQAYLAKHA